MGKAPYKKKADPPPTTNAPPAEILVDTVPNLPRPELQTALNLIPAHTWYAVPSGALTFVNERTADFLGLPKTHPLRFGIDTGAEWDSHLALLHPDDHEDSRQVWSTSLRTGCAAEGTFRVRNAEGGYRWFVSCAEPVRASDGTLLYWIGVNLDIEDRNQAEFYLAEGQRLAHMGSWAFGSGGFDYWSPELFRIHGRDPGDTAPTLKEYIELVHSDDREFVAESIQKMLDEHRGFDFTKRIVRPDGEIRRVRCVGGPATQAGAVHEFIGMGMDVTEHEFLALELGRHEAYLAEAQRLSHTGSFGWKPDTGEIIWSAETHRIFAYDLAVTPTIDLLLQRVHPEDRADVQSVIERASGGASNFEHGYRLLLLDGRVKYVHALAHVTLDAFGNREFVGAVTDITEQRLAEDSLRKSEAYLAEAQRLSHTGSWAWSPDTDVSYWSEECYRVLGFDPRDGLPRSEAFFGAIHPDDRPKFSELTERAIQNRQGFESDYRIVHRDGSVRDIHVVSHPALSPSGNLIEFMGTVIDITERKLAEAELRASESKYRHLVDTTPAFVHTGLPNGELDFFNRGWLEYVGVPITDLLGWGWTLAIHPEDVEELVARWRASLESGTPLVVESRVRRADGEYCWFLHRKTPLRNEAGEIVKWYGSSIIIQERKIAEQRIREQEIELSQILDLTPQLVAVLGPNRERLYANRGALDYLGLSLEEWRERSIGDEIHPDDLERLGADAQRALSKDAAFELELRVRKGDGSYRWFLARYNPVHSDDGQIMRWYSAWTDIEDRKIAEERLQHENIALREEIDKASMFEEIVGESPALRSVLVRVAKVAPTESTVLITGETGTGKELIARAIHKRSNRCSRAFVAVNCAAIPESLIASELFGHEKGSFTGAMQRRVGKFEAAEGGTLFLDEVGDLPAETQVALLRVLQEHEFERVGGNRPIPSNVRIVAATNRALESAIAAGEFRSDLYYRLNVFPIELPPLRERQPDIPLLAEYFIDRYSKKDGKRITGISKKALDLLISYHWPGNIRELQNVIERSLIVNESENFTVDRSWLVRGTHNPHAETQLLGEKLRTQEKAMIEAALAESSGRVGGPSGAAAKLGIPVSTLESKIKSLKIAKHRFKLS